MDCYLVTDAHRRRLRSAEIKNRLHVAHESPTPFSHCHFNVTRDEGVKLVSPPVYLSVNCCALFSFARNSKQSSNDVSAVIKLDCTWRCTADRHRAGWSLSLDGITPAGWRVRLAMIYEQRSWPFNERPVFSWGVRPWRASERPATITHCQRVRRRPRRCRVGLPCMDHPVASSMRHHGAGRFIENAGEKTRCTCRMLYGNVWTTHSVVICEAVGTTYTLGKQNDANKHNKWQSSALTILGLLSKHRGNCVLVTFIRAIGIYN